MSAEPREIDEMEYQQIAEDIGFDIDEFLGKSGIPDRVREFRQLDLGVQEVNEVKHALVNHMLEIAELIRVIEPKAE